MAVSITSYGKLSFVETSGNWDTHTREVLEESTTILASMVNRETGVRGYLVSGDDKFLEPYRAGQKTYADAFAKTKELTADNPAQQARLADIDRYAQTWHSTVAESEISLMAKPETQAEARAIEASGKGKTSMDGIRSTIAELQKTERDLLGKRSEEKAQAISVGYTVNIVGGIATVIVAIGAGLLLSRSIATPIRGMTVVMGRLAGGDNTVEIPGSERTDEIGAMAKAVVVFKTNAIENARLRTEQEEQKARAAAERKRAMMDMANKFESAVMGLVNGVSSQATELQATAQNINVGATQAAGQAATVAAGAQQATANVQTVATASEELSASIAEISRQVTEAAQVSATASEETARTNEIMQGLARAADKIGEVVKLINDIASQTNLLALNATIEAARAGEAGKGFAVVANEVKSLANQTAKATDEISGQISSVQEETKRAVDAIQNIGTVINQVKQISSGIASAVEEQGAATREIARNVQEAARGTENVSSNIVDIANAAEASVAASQQVLESSDELARNSETLTEEVSRFLSEVRAG